MEVGISSDDVFLIKNGDIIELKEDKCEIVGKIPLNEILIDGREKSKIDNLVICDRMRLSESGVVIIEICIDKKTGRCVSDLNIRCRGFLDEEKFSEISDELKDLSMKEISRFLGQGVRDERISNGITALAESFIKEKCEKTPIVIAFVTNVML